MKHRKCPDLWSFMCCWPRPAWGCRRAVRCWTRLADPAGGAARSCRRAAGFPHPAPAALCGRRTWAGAALRAARCRSACCAAGAAHAAQRRGRGLVQRQFRDQVLGGEDAVRPLAASCLEGFDLAVCARPHGQDLAANGFRFTAMPARCPAARAGRWSTSSTTLSIRTRWTSTRPAARPTSTSSDSYTCCSPI